MRQSKALHTFAVAATIAVVSMASLPVAVQAAGPVSDLVLFGPASNPGGFVGFIQLSDMNPSQFYPAFLPAAANVPNNIGVQFYEDPAHTSLSDQLWTQAGFWYFASEPDLINFASFGITSVGALTEDGTQQDVSAYFLLPPNSMSVMSTIPEPTAFALAGLSAAMVAVFRRRT
jgi:hypothetical protein